MMFEKIRRKLAEPFIPAVRSSEINRIIKEEQDSEDDKNVLLLIGANVMCDECLELDMDGWRYVVAHCNFGGENIRC